MVCLYPRPQDLKDLFGQPPCQVKLLLQTSPRLVPTNLLLLLSLNLSLQQLRPSLLLLRILSPTLCNNSLSFFAFTVPIDALFLAIDKAIEVG